MRDFTRKKIKMTTQVNTSNETREMMILTTEVIMTFDDNTQKKFNHRTNIVNDKNYSSYGLEKMLIKQIVFHSDKDKLNHLVKLSLCVYAKDNSEEVMNNTRISSIFKSEKNGKYYFQSDKRCAVVEELCKEYPEIAKDVIPYKEDMKNILKLKISY